MSEATALLQYRDQDHHKLGADVLLRLRQGHLIPAAGYINAQRLRRVIQQEFAKIWRRLDFLLRPTSPIGAPRIGVKTVTIGGQGEDILSASTRLLRCINVLGLQIIGAPFSERLLLSVAAALELEDETDRHSKSVADATRQ